MARYVFRNVFSDGTLVFVSSDFEVESERQKNWSLDGDSGVETITSFSGSFVVLRETKVLFFTEETSAASLFLEGREFKKTNFKFSISELDAKVCVANKLGKNIDGDLIRELLEIAQEAGALLQNFFEHFIIGDVVENVLTCEDARYAWISDDSKVLPFVSGEELIPYKNGFIINSRIISGEKISLAEQGHLYTPLVSKNGQLVMINLISNQMTIIAKKSSGIIRKNSNATNVLREIPNCLVQGGMYILKMETRPLESTGRYRFAGLGNMQPYTGISGFKAKGRGPGKHCVPFERLKNLFEEYNDDLLFEKDKLSSGEFNFCSLTDEELGPYKLSSKYTLISGDPAGDVIIKSEFLTKPEEILGNDEDEKYSRYYINQYLKKNNTQPPGFIFNKS